MQTISGSRATWAVRLAAIALVLMGAPMAALAQSKAPPASAARLGMPVDPVDTPGPSLVFPDGGFPSFPPKEATSSSKPGADAMPPAMLPPTSDYPAPGPREPQEGPATPEFYRPIAGSLPEYYYRPGYYNGPGIGARPLADYAPPGYEPRDQQVTPGTPEFTPIPVPEPITPEERAKFVTRGIFPGSFLVPGTNTSFRMRGFIRLQGFYDMDPIGSPDFFVPNTIPVPQTQGENFNFSARISRIAFETWTPTSFREWNVHTFLEGDFFNGAGQAAGGGGNPFRLRHAFIDFGYFRVGQQNTVFMDPSTWPSLVDFQGPAGWINQRQPSFRVTVPLADKVFWAASIERPFSDISTAGLGVNVQDVPDFATHFRYEDDLGHVQIAALLRTIGYRPTGGEVTRRPGLGLSAATTLHPWALLIGSNPVRKSNPTALERCRLIGQYTMGWGIARYINDAVGLGLDGQVDPATGGFDVPYIAAYNVSYEHWYTERWLTNLTYSQTLAASNTGQPGSTYTGANYLGASVWFIPIANLSLGIEYLWGQRENLDGQSGRANRLTALVQYNF